MLNDKYLSLLHHLPSSTWAFDHHVVLDTLSTLNLLNMLFCEIVLLLVHSNTYKVFNCFDFYPTLLSSFSRYPWRLLRAWAWSWRAQLAVAKLFCRSTSCWAKVRFRHRLATPHSPAPSPCTSSCPASSKASSSTHLGWLPACTQARNSPGLNKVSILLYLTDCLTGKNLQCLHFFTHLSLCLLVEGAMKRAKIARNTHMAPPGSKIVLMSQVFKQTLAKTSDKLTGANVKIHRCSEAFIYLLSPLR